MCFACWVTKVADTHSEYVTLDAFPWQQWLQEHVSMLHYMDIAFFCLIDSFGWECSILLSFAQCGDLHET